MNLDMILWISVGVFAVLAALSIWLRIRRKKKERKEAATDAMMDKMTLRRASIQTHYIENDLFQVIQQAVLSKYTLNPQYLNPQKMHPQFAQNWYNDLKREYDVNVRKQVNDFRMDNARIVKQDNSSMYAVTHLEAEATFYVDYFYAHPTRTAHIQKQFKQRFVFQHYSEEWVLQEVKPETDVAEQELPFQPAVQG